MIKILRTFCGIIFVLAILTMAGWYLYAPTLAVPFVFDDVPQILQNPFIRFSQPSLHGLGNLLKCPNANRVLAYGTFALNYYFNGYDVTGYHLFNVAVHILTALLVYIIARLTLDLCGTKNAWTPFLASVLWLVNPVHTQSVTYIVQRMNALSAMFVLLALICYVQARREQVRGNRGIKANLLLIAAGIAGLCGLASKETAAILPVILFLYEWFFIQNLDRAWLRKQTGRIGLTIILLIIIALIYMDGDPIGKLMRMYEKRGFTPVQRLLTEPQVVLYYLTLLFFPHPARLNLDYTFPLARSPINPATTLPAILALLALAAVAVYAAKKHRLISFAILWFLTTLVIESSVIGQALLFEHRTYLPSVFPVIAATWILTRWIKPQPMALLTITALIVLCGYGTYQRNRVWADSLQFWKDGNAKSPGSPRILNNLGMAYMEINRTESACHAFEKALLNDPEMISALNNRGTILLEKEEPEKALALFDKAIKIEPEYYDAHYNRGLALIKLDRIPDATQAFAETIRLNPFYEKAHNNLGTLLMRQLEPDQAMTHFQRALEIDPSFVETYSNIGLAYYKNGMTDKALEWFNKALDMDPFYVDAYNNQRRVRSQEKKYWKTIIRLARNFNRHPDNPDIAFHLAEAYRQAGMTFKALEYYKKALALQPDALDCLNRLGNFYIDHDQYQRAAEMFERLSALRPEEPVIHYNLACLYALQHQPEKALSHLEAAIKFGYDKWNQIASDKDLENIHNTEYFRKIINAHQGKKGG